MLEKVGKMIASSFRFIFKAIGSIIGLIAKGVSVGIAAQIPWYVKLIILLLIISILMPTIQTIYKAVAFIIKKAFGLFKNNTQKNKK